MNTDRDSRFLEKQTDKESSEQRQESLSLVAASVNAVFGDILVLKVVCAQKNYTVANVPYDGNCLFNALAIQLGRQAEAEAARHVRAEIVSHLRNHHNMVYQA